MTRLNDLQLVLLTAAARRNDGSLLPPPVSVGEQAARILKAIPPLIKRALVAEGPATAAAAWQSDGDDHVGVFITAAGREAIGAMPRSTEIEGAVVPDVTSASDKKPTKAGLVLSLLQREQGATLEEMVTATGWLPHTTRAALTGLRKKGHAIAKGKRDDVTYYSVKVAA